MRGGIGTAVVLADSGGMVWVVMEGRRESTIVEVFLITSTNSGGCLSMSARMNTIATFLLILMAVTGHTETHPERRKHTHIIIPTIISIPIHMHTRIPSPVWTHAATPPCQSHRWCQHTLSRTHKHSTHYRDTHTRSTVDV